MKWLFSIIILFLSACKHYPNNSKNFNFLSNKYIIKEYSCYIYWNDSKLKEKYFLKENKINNLGKVEFHLFDNSIDVIVVQNKNKEGWNVVPLYSEKLQNYFLNFYKQKDVSNMRNIFVEPLFITNSELQNMIFVRDQINCDTLGIKNKKTTFT